MRRLAQTLHTWLKISNLVLGCVLLLSSIVWTEKRGQLRSCQAIDVHVVPGRHCEFVEKNDLCQRLQEAHVTCILGNTLGRVALRRLKNSVDAHSFVRYSTLYKTWKGRLKIWILPKRPVARWLDPCRAGTDLYIDEYGELLPLSDTYTARVMLVSAEKQMADKGHLQNSAHGLSLLKVLNVIDQDPFWRAQIAHIKVDERNKLVLTTQISKQKVYFGRPDRVQEKLQKLHAFYTVVLPYKGWNTYQRVNLEFQGQIVCE
ncbi:MAG: hypothetical protein AAFU83_02700 [Bacteroidota bacterium]